MNERTNSNCNGQGGQLLNRAELYEVRCHQKRLSEREDREVSFTEALKDWLEHYALDWRQNRQRVYLEKQREEILRHKWIESEKANRDLGSKAVLDWIANYAAQWRESYEKDEERQYQTNEG